MSIAGKGMLLTAMDVDPADQQDFNRWYDREHLVERVAIDGFMEARRYEAINASPTYLSTYSTDTFEVLDSPAYRKALANQTEWSKANISRFKNMLRAVGRLTVSRGQGRGAVLGLIRLRPSGADDAKLRMTLLSQCEALCLRDGIISAHLLESDPALSRPLTDDLAAFKPAAGDWYMMIDATEVEGLAMLHAEVGRSVATQAAVVSQGTYRLLWDLAKIDL